VTLEQHDAATGAPPGPGPAAWAGRLRDPALLTALPLAGAALLPFELSAARSGNAVSGALLALVTLALTLWAAPALVARPTVAAVWSAAAARHRNTLFAAYCVILAALDHPAAYLAALDAGLLLAYLATLDARTAGPVGARQARSRVILPAAAACTALTLAAALAPAGSAAAWARLAAALAVTCAGALVGAALWARRTAAKAADPGPGAPAGTPPGARRRH
jgi:hypothetical protein